MLIRIVTAIMLFTSLIKAEPFTDVIKKTHDKIANINIEFLNEKYPDESFIVELGNLFKELQNQTDADITKKTRKEYINRIEQLIKSIHTLHDFVLENSKVDTLKKLFRTVNNEFNTIFGNYYLEALNNSNRQKIIIFSTSMSCECTLEMCYNQEAIIQKLQKENPELFDYAVIDTWTDSEIQNKYNVGFIPTIILTDNKDKELKRFIRNENLYEDIKLFLTGSDK